MAPLFFIPKPQNAKYIFQIVFELDYIVHIMFNVVPTPFRVAATTKEHLLRLAPFFTEI